MVRLLREAHRDEEAQNASFNPTMVRLLLKSNSTFGLISLLFQSHNGAIAASL